MSRAKNWESLETDVQFASVCSLTSEKPSLPVCNGASVGLRGGKEPEISDLGLVKVALLVILMTAYRAETSTSEACRRRWLLGSS
jgi:hypothetical protein